MRALEWLPGTPIATSEAEKQHIGPVAVSKFGEAAWITVLVLNGLRFALRLSSEIYIVEIQTERDAIEDLSDNWELLIGVPAKAKGIPEPKLVVLESDVRRFYTPFVDFVFALELSHPDRDILVVIPELVMTRWWAALLHNNRGTLVRTLLRMQCGPRVFIVDASYRLH